MHKRVLSLFLILMISVVAIAACDSGKSEEKKEGGFTFNDGDYIKVVYFHGDKRCTTCLTIEEFSKDAVTIGFEKEIKEGEVTWETYNYDDEGQEYLMDVYELINQALIIIYVEDGEQKEWKNLGKVWELTNDKAEFIAYVEKEVRIFLSKI